MKLTVVIDTKQELDGKQIADILSSSNNIVEKFLSATVKPFSDNHMFGSGIKAHGTEYSIEIKCED